MDGSLFIPQHLREEAYETADQKTFELFDLKLTNSTLDEISRKLVQSAQARLRLRVAFVNAHCSNVASMDHTYNQDLKSADMLLPDGSGVRVASKICGQEMGENLNGTDLFIPMCKEASKRGVSIYLLGAKPGIADKVAQNVKSKVKGLNISGVRDGYFTPDQEQTIIDDINQSGAGLLFVAMGVPLQDCWLAKNRDRISVPVVMGVGGLFDFFSGRIPRAPQWLRKIGMEWTYRLYQEPIRLFRRYIIGNPLFLARACFSASSQYWKKATATASFVSKRLLDISASALGLLALAPLLLIIGGLIKLNSKGPILFEQKRVGEDGKLFKMFKFRSMYEDAEIRLKSLRAQNERGDNTSFKMKNDPRVTPIGRFIRRYSIDELPQLLNVLKGDMSVVGPRPPLPSEVMNYDSYAMERLKGKPGLTCIWQVAGRADISFEQQVEMDIFYLKKRSLWLDLKLILLTVPAVLSGRGAY
jgi:exopolysaccharide biosynthesis WecB/TagA/CpsF family protein